MARVDERPSRRPAGTGALFVRRDAHGRETWYGKWRVAGRQVKRRLGLRRASGAESGLTQREAEAALRNAVAETQLHAAVDERLTVALAAERYLRHLERVLDRKPSTIQDYGIIVRRHIAPFLGDRYLEGVSVELVDDYVHAKLRDGLAVKTVINHLNLLNSVFAHSVKRGWAQSNPVSYVDRPRTWRNLDIRFLTPDEIETLLAAVDDDLLGPTDRTLYLTAALTGLRQGELIALRWQDVDWSACVIRVRRNFTRGRFGPPKSRRSSRAVPMATRVADALCEHFKRSTFTRDDGLVFPHPQTGAPYDSSRLRKRFKATVGRTDVRPIRFHDLRHTFGTRMAAAGAPLRAIQEWMGHCDYQTTLVYADYAPDPSQGTVWSQRAFGA